MVVCQPRGRVNHLSYPAPPRARCVESSRLVLVVVYTPPVPVHSLPVSGVLTITMNVDQLQLHWPSLNLRHDREGNGVS